MIKPKYVLEKSMRCLYFPSYNHLTLDMLALLSTHIQYYFNGNISCSSEGMLNATFRQQA